MNARSNAVAVALLFHAAASGLAGQERGRPEGGEGGIEVRGAVVDHETGEALQGAAVSLGRGRAGLPARGTRVADDEGRFLFRNVPAGDYPLSVALLGYHPMADTIHVSTDGDLDLVLPLSVEPIHLEPIVVEVELEAALRGYQNRNRSGSGPFLITRDEIERRHPLRLTDLLASVPGARVIRRFNLGSVLLLRGDCAPVLVVDGVSLPHGSGIDRLVSPGDVETVEVFHGAELPVQYGLNTCGGVVIRTRRGEPPQEGEDAEASGGIWRKVALVGLAAFGILLSTR